MSETPQKFTELETRLVKSSKTQRDRATERLYLVKALAVRIGNGETIRQAALAVAEDANAQRGVGRRQKLSPRTLEDYWRKTRGLPHTLWLAALLDDHRGRGPSTQIDPYYYDQIKKAFVDHPASTYVNAYEQVKALAVTNGVQLAKRNTYWRHFKKHEDPTLITRLKKGRGAAFQEYPMQIRTALRPNYAWAIDGHEFDYRVLCADGQVRRPWGLGIIDLSSKKWLTIRLAFSENKGDLLSAFATAFERHGVPEHVILDNGKGNCSNWLMGGIPTRRKRTVKDEEPLGAFVRAGTEPHLKTPRWAWANPIEPNWRGVEAVLMQPLLKRGYTGNNVLNKPEGYGGHVPWELFDEALTAGVNAINARIPENNTPSRNALYDEWCTRNSHLIPRLTAHQLRRVASAVAVVPIRQGGFTFNGKRYTNTELCPYNGKKVQALYDFRVEHPDIVDTEAFDGTYICTAQRLDPVGLFDKEAAKQHNGERREWLKELDAKAQEFESQFERKKEGRRLLDAVKSVYPATEQAPSAVSRGTFEKSALERKRREQARREAEETMKNQARVGELAYAQISHLRNR